MTRRSLCVLAMLLATGFGVSSSAVAQMTGSDPGVVTPAAPTAGEEEEGGWLSRFSGSIQADFSNAYFFRGILQERDSLVAEPWGELYFSLYSSEDGFLRDLSIGGGVWASFHTEETGASSPPKSLYEVDYYPVLAAEFEQGLSLTAIYYFYSSPNDAYSTVQELNFKFAWDDSETLGRFALQPWVNLAIETVRSSLGPNKGVGMQMGVEPTLFEIPIENYPITLTLPVEIGLSLDEYYERASGSESTFGYLSFGMGASMPLAFVPKQLGAWSIGVVGKGYWLNHTLANVNLGRTMSPQVIGSIGLEF